MKAPLPNPTHGITLIELIVVIAIIAILSSLAAPSFRETTQKFRAIAAVNGFAGDLRFARSEAQKQGAPVTICASSNGTTCTNSSTWQIGWIVFSDPTATQTVSQLLRVKSAFSNADSLAANTGASAVTINRDGFPQSLSGAPSVKFRLLTTPANTLATQCVDMSRTGSVIVYAGANGLCP